MSDFFNIIKSWTVDIFDRFADFFKVFPPQILGCVVLLVGVAVAYKIIGR